MNAQEFLDEISDCGINVITGVPDSTLKPFCDELQLSGTRFRHMVAANEGAAVGIAIGSYLAGGKPVCVYLQNSGIGNVVNPVASLANAEVYGIPMLFIVGWRGEPGTKDEPQHLFQGRITCQLFDTLAVPHEIIDKSTTIEDVRRILAKAKEAFSSNRQFALIVRKGTFEKGRSYQWENGLAMRREEFLGKLLQVLPEKSCIVSTTGKISRELYEQSNRLYGNHDNLFMTVGGMGHASMIAYGIAQERSDVKVVCVDGDGAALMHLGALPFLASCAPHNLYHVVVNNNAHESVGGMPTECREVSFARIAEASGYRHSMRIETEQEIRTIGEVIAQQEGPCLFEAMVALGARENLGRPAESARENREAFTNYLQSL